MILSAMAFAWIRLVRHVFGVSFSDGNFRSSVQGGERGQYFGFWIFCRNKFVQVSGNDRDIDKTFGKILRESEVVGKGYKTLMTEDFDPSASR